MRQSSLFTKTRRETPTGEVAKNAILLIRAGYLHKELSGVYSFLPLGLRVLNRIAEIIRHEMDALGGEEVLLSALQDRVVWEKTNRWDEKKIDTWFKTTLRKGGTVVGLGFTHEEPLTRILTAHVRSFRDLPRSIYQFQTKFRNEERAKSGVLRTREFLMKDLYSFSRTQDEHERFYEKVRAAYHRIFDAVGIGRETFLTFASGGSFSKYSHEFQTIADAGEDTVHQCLRCHVAVNDEIIAEKKQCPSCGGRELKKAQAIEVGNIFSLGTQFSEALGLRYVAEDGTEKPVVMGSYGIGLARVMGAVVEIHADEAGLVWPERIAPFRVHLLSIGEGGKLEKKAALLYDRLRKGGVPVLFDDRDVSAGEKFADADLIGIPTRLLISEKLEKEGNVEIKDRKSGDIRHVPPHSLLSAIPRAATA